MTTPAASPTSRAAILRKWLPVIAWSAAIFILSTASFSAVDTLRTIEKGTHAIIPGASVAAISVIHLLARKGAHFAVYGILFRLLVRGPMAKRRGLALLICIGYAMTDEFHQIFVPGRGASLYDVALDSSGALFSLYLLNFFREFA
ncbi:MAG: VanZ family protein [Candidatus Binataceae bacterium]